MSRTAQFIKGVASGYLSLVVNIVYTMGTIPLALHYLTKEEFGLWALVMQISAYFSLIDCGMYVSAARYIIDVKDDKHDVRYGATVFTSGLVFVIQGAIVALAGLFLAPLTSHLVKLPAQFSGAFTLLIIFQCLFLAGGFMTRIFAVILGAHQRYDIINVTQSVQLVIMGLALWVGFHFKMGVFSMVTAAAIGFLWNSGVQIAACMRLSLLPKPGLWGRPNMKSFIEMFLYGKDMFLIGLGWQLLSASQAIIITRVMGLDAVATWSVCTKAFTLSQQFITKIYDYSQAAFSEMYVRGETERLRNRFKDAVVLTAAVSVFTCVIVALCNGTFVQVWTHGKIGWAMGNDLLMGTFILVDTVMRCYNSFVVHTTKQVKFARWIYLLEGLVFIPAAYLAGKQWGFPGIFIPLILVKVLGSSAYGIFRVKTYFHCSYRSITWDWLLASFLYFVAFGAIGSAVLLGSRSLDNTTRLFLMAGALCLTGLPLLWKVGLNSKLRQEMLGVASKAYGSLPKGMVAVKK